MLEECYEPSETGFMGKGETEGGRRDLSVECPGGSLGPRLVEDRMSVSVEL